MIGRCWQHLFLNAPFRTFLWNEELLKPVVEGLTSLSWHQYATSYLVDQWIQYSVQFFGLIYGLGAIVVLFCHNKKKLIGRYLVTLFGCLFLLSFLYYMEKFFYLAMLFEYAIQIMTPLIVYAVLFNKYHSKYFQLGIMLGVSLTFLGHGLFALGLYPVPGHFIDMIVNVFGFNESGARILLKVAGTLDLMACALIFYRPARKYALYFMIGWGGLTAAARIVAHIDFNLFMLTGHQWVYETLVRVPHALVPLFILLTLKKEGQQNVGLKHNQELIEPRLLVGK